MSSQHGGTTPGSGAVSDRMQELLARAAEEQLLEQRQVSAVLGELRALVQEVDERLATGEQVERVAAEVRALSARVEGRLDAAEARSAELAERVREATATAGRAAQELVGAVAAGVAEQVETQLRELTAGTAASVAAVVEGSERRLATHVDDAVLALAEVVLRRRSPVPPPAPPDPATTEAPTAVQLLDGEPPDPPAAPQEPAAPSSPAATAQDAPAARPLHEDAPPGDSTAAHLFPGDGFVLVPADVEEPEAGPAPPVHSERRTAERRASERSDGSGRRRRPWWRPV